MATTYDNAIQQLYVAYFNRPADVAGLAYWNTVVAANNGSTAQVSASFAASAEYKATYANMTNTQVVNAVYENLFGRAADSAGSTYWSNLLDTGKVSINDVVNDVAAGAIGTDMTAFNNKTTAAVAFTQAMDTTAEQAGYTADSVDLAKDFIASVTTNATLADAILPAHLNATIAEVVAAGTPFTVVGGLQGLETAMTAETAYLKSITAADATSTATETSVAGDLTDAKAAFATVFSTQDSASYATYNGTDSAAVKAALINDQVADNAKALTQAQSDLKDATDDVAAVKGLQSAIDKLAAAQATQKTVTTAQTAADADLQAKEASFNFLSSAKIGDATLHVDATTGAITLVPADPAGATVTLVNANADGSLTLATSVTEKTYPGITALVTSVTADLAAHVAATNAGIVVGTAQDNLTALGHGDLVTAEATATTHVSDAQDAISDFNSALSDLTTAQQHSDDLAGYQATIDTITTTFDDNGFNLVPEVTGSLLASADSDVYMVGTANATINLFGLQGVDSLYIGTGYTQVNGKLATGSDATLEAFVTQTGANTTIQLEQHAFSSHVTGAATSAEIVTITLVGVTATDVHLDANGIISLGHA